MEDSSTLRHHDVVPDAQLTLTIWKAWSNLVQACAVGNIADVMTLGVTAKSTYRSPNIDRMTEEAKKECFLNRAFIALFVAVHRGHVPLIKALLDRTGVNIMSTTKLGRNILHVAAANGRNKCIDLLLHRGAGELINSADKLGATPLQTAAAWGHKSAEGKLFLYQWRKRAGKMAKIPQAHADQLMAHQMFDSSRKTWLRGRQSQMYHGNVLPPQEFQGTSLGSKRSTFSIKTPNTNSKTDLPGTSSPPETSTAKHIQSDDAVLTRGWLREGFEEIAPLQCRTAVSGPQLRRSKNAPNEALKPGMQVIRETELNDALRCFSKESSR